MGDDPPLKSWISSLEIVPERDTLFDWFVDGNRFFTMIICPKFFFRVMLCKFLIFFCKTWNDFFPRQKHDFRGNLVLRRLAAARRELAEILKFLKILSFFALVPPRPREDAGNRSQIVSGCVRDVCDALARVSALPQLRKPQKINRNQYP